MKIFCLLIMVLMPAVVKAEVFKCTDKIGKTIYQSKPCPASEKSKQLLINPVTPEEDAQARAKFNTLQAEYDANKAKQLEDENHQQQINQALKQNANYPKQPVDMRDRQLDRPYQSFYGPLLGPGATGSNVQTGRAPEAGNAGLMEEKQESIVQKRLADPVFDNAVKQKQDITPVTTPGALQQMP